MPVFLLLPTLNIISWYILSHALYMATCKNVVTEIYFQVHQNLSNINLTMYGKKCILRYSPYKPGNKKMLDAVQLLAQRVDASWNIHEVTSIQCQLDLWCESVVSAGMSPTSRGASCQIRLPFAHQLVIECWNYGIHNNNWGLYCKIMVMSDATVVTLWVSFAHLGVLQRVKSHTLGTVFNFPPGLMCVN